jgi:hypothetical protein
VPGLLQPSEIPKLGGEQAQAELRSAPVRYAFAHEVTL